MLGTDVVSESAVERSTAAEPVRASDETLKKPRRGIQG